MSGIWGWFGGGASKRKDSPKNVILTLRTQLEMLQKREAHLHRQIEQQEEIARKNVTSNKTGRLPASGLHPQPCCDMDMDADRSAIPQLRRRPYDARNSMNTTWSRPSTTS
jgi:hypothetical protein